MKVSTVNQAITASAAVVTAAASIVVASAAWQTVELARHEWIIVPAPANAEGRLTRAGVHLTWELAERHAYIMRGIQVLMGPSPRAGETPRGQRVVTEHGLATESWVPLCIERRPSGRRHRSVSVRDAWRPSRARRVLGILRKLRYRVRVHGSREAHPVGIAIVDDDRDHCGAGAGSGGRAGDPTRSRVHGHALGLTRDVVARVRIPAGGRIHGGGGDDGALGPGLGVRLAHRVLRERRHRALRLARRQRLRQHAGGDDHRVVKGRGHSPARSLAPSRGGGVGDAGVGRVVQPSPVV